MTVAVHLTPNGRLPLDLRIIRWPCIIIADIGPSELPRAEIDDEDEDSSGDDNVDDDVWTGLPVSGFVELLT